MRQLQRFLSVVGAVHFHIVLLQTEPDSFHNQFFIINHQSLFTHFSSRLYYIFTLHIFYL